MFIFVLFFLAICLILVGVGIVLGIVGAACASILVAMGIAATSTLVAFWHRSWTSGLRVFHYLILAATGSLAGVAVACTIFMALDLSTPRGAIILCGLWGGVSAGLVIAFLGDYSARLLYRRAILAASVIKPRNITLPPAPAE